METATGAERYTRQDKRVWLDVIGALVLNQGLVPGPQSSHREVQSGKRDVNHNT